MQRRTLLKQLGLSIPALMASRQVNAAAQRRGGEKMLGGVFKPEWSSLQQFQTPSWFQDAKFGLWAHWGPQCQPEAGDWYARGMYLEGSRQYKYHIEKYGHPSVFGFKDVVHQWKAENWDPEELVALYKTAGARYFVALANHHDNLDLYDSKYQPWNSVRVGPKKDLIAAWARAARRQGLFFGVSIHAAHAWSWYEPAQRSDKEGKFAGIPYDGKLTEQAGRGKWWQDLDPQQLYSQNHALSQNSQDNGTIHKQWNWGNGVTAPSQAYIDKFFNRTIELINKYNPDLLYFDDTALPLWPVSDAGLRIAAHLYNKSIQQKGSLQAVVTGKILDENQRKAMVWDIERGQSNAIEPLPWQTDTCIGDWHYDRGIYERKAYKTAKTVIHTLADVVSKNGNLLLNIPIRGDGTIDSEERPVVEEIGRWMKANGESIYGTRPWKVFGEGPAQESAAALTAQGFNEGKGKPFSEKDVRFTTKGDALFAIVLGWPGDGVVAIKSLAQGNPLLQGAISKISMVSNGQALAFEQTPESLVVHYPEGRPAEYYATALKIQ